MDNKLLTKLIETEAEEIITRNNNYISKLVMSTTENEEMRKNLTTLINNSIFKKMAKEVGYNV